MSPSESVVVVGAGLAGLAAAVELSSRGIPVTVLEQHRRGGGRAYSFTDRTTGDTVDNGQHALIAGCTATMRYLDLISTRRFLHTQRSPSLTFHHPALGLRRLRIPDLPSPLHLAGGILSTDLFSLADRLRLLRLGWALARLRDDDPFLSGASVAEWLRRHGQSAETIRTLWEPLAIAIMNERTEKASALLFARCLRRAFLGRTGDSALVLPSVGLSELFVTPACALISKHGGRIILGARAAGTILREGRVTGVRLEDGAELPASVVILAVPAWSIGRVLPEEMPRRAALLKAAELPVSPIVSVHLWYTTDFMHEEAIGIVGRTIQWVFNRRKIEEKGGQGGHITCVISAAHDLIGEPSRIILAAASDDLRAVFGKAGGDPIHSVVIREKRGTVSPIPGAERDRPDQITGIPNLFIAGDWTSTGLPGTIEGAVWSGKRCADLVQARQLHLIPSLS